MDSGSKSKPVRIRAAGSVPQAAGLVAGRTLKVNGGRSVPAVGSHTVFHGMYLPGSLSTTVSSTTGGTPWPRLRSIR